MTNNHANLSDLRSAVIDLAKGVSPYDLVTTGFVHQLIADELDPDITTAKAIAVLTGAYSRLQRDA